MAVAAWQNSFQTMKLKVPRLLLQRSTSIRTQTVAGVLRQNFRHLHQAVEVPAAAPPDTGHQVRAQAVADRRDRVQNRTTLLPLLVSVNIAKHTYDCTIIPPQKYSDTGTQISHGG